jgi:hypothetical protein
VEASGDKEVSLRVGLAICLNSFMIINPNFGIFNKINLVKREKSFWSLIYAGQTYVTFYIIA